jgi:hypothetical protein
MVELNGNLLGPLNPVLGETPLVELHVWVPEGHKRTIGLYEVKVHSKGVLRNDILGYEGLDEGGLVPSQLGVGKTYEPFYVQKLIRGSVSYEERGIEGVIIEFDVEGGGIGLECAVQVPNLYGGKSVVG